MIATGINIITPSENRKRYSSHYMVTYSRFTDNLPSLMQRYKDAGYNHIWAFMDDYLNTIPTDIINLMDAAYSKGIEVMPGTQNGTPNAQTVQMFLDTWNHPALFRRNGKRVYAGYSYSEANFYNLVTELTNAGINRSDFIFWAYTNTIYEVNAFTSVNDLYDACPNLDGVINFAVDKATSDTATLLNRINTENYWTSYVSRQRSKYSMAGINGFYASTQTTDLGFQGLASQWNKILSIDLASRPDAVNDTTADDYNEYSYMSPNMVAPLNGFSFIPELTRGFTDVVSPDHSGMQKFVRPFVDAYLYNKQAATINEDKIFAWYWTHPINAPLISTIPSEVSALAPHLNQTWWNASAYKNGSARINQMKYFLADQMGKIRMAVHLKRPSYLRIKIAGTDFTSPLINENVGYLECPQSLGTITFSILNTDLSIRKQGSSSRAISNSCFPAAWVPTVEEIINTI